jgi:hypothetical protein
MLAHDKVELELANVDHQLLEPQNWPMWIISYLNLKIGQLAQNQLIKHSINNVVYFIMLL